LGTELVLRADVRLTPDDLAASVRCVLGEGLVEHNTGVLKGADLGQIVPQGKTPAADDLIHSEYPHGDSAIPTIESPNRGSDHDPPIV
jgi:hypothetical protein